MSGGTQDAVELGGLRRIFGYSVQLLRVRPVLRRPTTGVLPPFSGLCSFCLPSQERLVH